MNIILYYSTPTLSLSHLPTPTMNYHGCFQTILFFIIIPLSISLYLFFLKPKSKPTTGFKLYPLVGSLPQFLRNRHRFLVWSTQVLSTCPTNTATFRRPGKIHGIITANPSNVEHMLKTNFDNYPKGSRFISLLQDFLGQGIFNSDGEIWKIQRKTASYEFNTKSLRNFVIDNVNVELRTRLIPILGKMAGLNRVHDLQDLLERFAFDNICKVAFNVDPGCLGGDATGGRGFMKAFEDAATLSSGRFMYALHSVFVIKKFFNIGSEKLLKNAIATVHQFADRIIRLRMEERAEKTDEDLLSRFIGNSDYSAEFLRDIVISFILAGRDTTSAGLTWFFWLLSQNPKVEMKILDELKQIRSRSGKSIGDSYTFEDLREMNYLHAAISEGLRLYPPVPIDTKACLKDDVMPDGTFVGKDWFVTYHTYAMGRMTSVWGEDCCEFRPERWLDMTGVCKSESPFRFPVFHGGLRMCLGKEMAYMQMKSIAAAVIERFEIEVQGKGNVPEHILSLTLRMKGGLNVKLKERFVGVRN